MGVEIQTEPNGINDEMRVELKRLGIEVPESAQSIDPKVVEFLQPNRLEATNDPVIFKDTTNGKEYIVSSDGPVFQGVFYPSITEVMVQAPLAGDVVVEVHDVQLK